VRRSQQNEIELSSSWKLLISFIEKITVYIKTEVVASQMIEKGIKKAITVSNCELHEALLVSCWQDPRKALVPP